MAKIGYREEKSDFFADVFRAIDADGSGVFSIHDLHMFINNIEGRRSKAKKLTLPGDEGDVTKQVLVGGVMYPCALKLVEWNENSLREALQVMFIEAGVAPLDMLRAFDYDGSGASVSKNFWSCSRRLSTTTSSGTRLCVRS